MDRWVLGGWMIGCRDLAVWMGLAWMGGWMDGWMGLGWMIDR